MHLFEGQTANEAWGTAAATFVTEGGGCEQTSRAGKTREILHAAFTIRNPLERWVIARRPTINPAFAIAETVWILAGRNDSALPNHWNPGLPNFAGLGERYHGAYGYRLRHRFGLDQLERAYLALLSNSDSRQVALQVWDPRIDLPDKEGKPTSLDIPCNLLSLLKVRNGKLEWTQVMRSNDLFRGVPYNFVQFTTLQEVIAGWLGLEVGSYDQLSDSLHVYERDFASLDEFDRRTEIMPNTDSLRLPKEESDAAFAAVERRLDAMTEDDLTEQGMRELLEGESLPEAFENLLRVVAADSARRRGWIGLSEATVGSCTNEALLQAWKGWSLRTRSP